MFCLVKWLLNRKFDNLGFIPGSNTPGNMNNYDVTYIVERDHDPRTNGNLKFAMFITWKKVGKKAIVIGQNPAEAHSNLAVDNTNQNIVALLKKAGYSGYVMINTFPEINSAGNTINNITPNKKNILISKFLLKFFFTKIIACSTSNNIDFNFYTNVLNRNRFRAIKADGIIVSHFSSQSFSKIGSISSIRKVKSSRVSLSINESNTQNNTCKISF